MDGKAIHNFITNTLRKTSPVESRTGGVRFLFTIRAGTCIPTFTSLQEVHMFVAFFRTLKLPWHGTRYYVLSRFPSCAFRGGHAVEGVLTFPLRNTTSVLDSDASADASSELDTFNSSLRVIRRRSRLVHSVESEPYSSPAAKSSVLCLESDSSSSGSGCRRRWP